MKARTIFLCCGLLWVAATIPAFSQPSGDSLGETIVVFNNLGAEQKDAILSSMGLSTAADFSWAKILACLIFNGIGFVAFIYGKKQRSFQPLLIGIVLMVYPYFLNNTFWLYAVGLVLCFLLHFWRD